MLRENEVKGIKPFNDVFYKSCMYNPLLTGLIFAGGGVLPFLSNDFFTYMYAQDDIFSFYGKNIQVLPEHEIINKMGIKIDYNFNIQNYVNEIKEAIDYNATVFVPIDRYYWSDSTINAPHYKIRHFRHYMLIYGYNNIDNNFKIFDVTLNGMGCYTSLINCDELVECYKGYREAFADEQKIFKIYQNSSISSDVNDINKHISIYKKNFHDKKDEIYTGLEDIKKVINNYKLYNPDEFINENENLQNYAMPFFVIENIKKVQMYQSHVFFKGNNQLIVKLKDIFNNISIIKGIYLKMRYIKICNNKMLIDIAKRLSQIYDTENFYYDNISKILNDWSDI